MTLKSPTSRAGDLQFQEVFDVIVKSLKPAKLVVELRAGRGVAIWKRQEVDQA
jgi:hypothetical protein